MKKSYKDLWNFVCENGVRRRYCWKYFIVIPADKFELIKEYFTLHKNFFYPEPEYRSNQLFLHVHGIDFGNEIICHIDMVNFKKFKIIGSIPHMLFDYVPYAITSLLKGERPKRYF